MDENWMIYNRNIVKLLEKRGFGGNAPNKLKAYAEGGGASLQATHAVGMAKSLSLLYKAGRFFWEIRGFWLADEWAESGYGRPGMASLM